MIEQIATTRATSEGLTTLHYALVKAISVKLLEQPEKNALGFYTGRTALWQRLVKAYEKEGP